MALMPESRESALKTATEAVTLLLATAGLIYVLGGLALAIRLWFANLPVQATVAALPETLVITVGLSEVVAPALIVGVIAVIVLVVSPGNVKKNSFSRVEHSQRVWLVIVLAMILMLAPGTVRAGASYELSFKWLSYLGAIVIAMVAAIAARMLINHIFQSAGIEENAESANLGQNYLKPAPLMKIGATVAALGAVGSLIFVGGRQLVPVTACLEGGGSIPTEMADGRNAYLIGQSSDKAYLALGVDYDDSETSTSDDEAVLSIADERVSRILYGTGVRNGKQSCQS
jgi:lysylphosphatidylglycerol synthetase-like protein (DUF2156 family)